MIKSLSTVAIFFRRYFFDLAQWNSLQLFRRSRRFPCFQKCNKGVNKKDGYAIVQGAG